MSRHVKFETSPQARLSFECMYWAAKRQQEMPVQTSADVKMCTSCFDRSLYFVNLLLKHLTAVRKSPMKKQVRVYGLPEDAENFFSFFLFFKVTQSLKKTNEQKKKKSSTGQPSLWRWLMQRLFRKQTDKLWCCRWTNGKHPRTQQQLIKINCLPINYQGGSNMTYPQVFLHCYFTLPCTTLNAFVLSSLWKLKHYR